jgi:hypothetical protein
VTPLRSARRKGIAWQLRYASDPRVGASTASVDGGSKRRPQGPVNSIHFGLVTLHPGGRMMQNSFPSGSRSTRHSLPS